MTERTCGMCPIRDTESLNCLSGPVGLKKCRKRVNKVFEPPLTMSELNRLIKSHIKTQEKEYSPPSLSKSLDSGELPACKIASAEPLFCEDDSRPEAYLVTLKGIGKEASIYLP